MYIKVDDGMVSNIIHDENPSMPGVPIERRFPASYISSLLKLPDDTQVGIGWAFNGETFEEVPQPEPIAESEPIPPTPSDVEKLRADVDYIAMETGVVLDV